MSEPRTPSESPEPTCICHRSETASLDCPVHIEMRKSAPSGKNESCGLTYAQLEVACSNVGVDISCPDCAMTFFTGFTGPTDRHDFIPSGHPAECKTEPRMGQPQPSPGLRSLVQSVLAWDHDCADCEPAKEFHTGTLYHEKECAYWEAATALASAVGIGDMFARETAEQLDGKLGYRRVRFVEDRRPVEPWTGGAKLDELPPVGCVVAPCTSDGPRCSRGTLGCEERHSARLRELPVEMPPREIPTPVEPRSANALPGAEDLTERYRVALTKINAIRDSIVGTQGFNFSEHAYPLVAALDDAGFTGLPYPLARTNVGTLIERAIAAASPAPWRWATSNSWRRLTSADGRDGGVLYPFASAGDGHPNCAITQEDMTFIELARDALPALVVEVRRLQNVIKTGGAMYRFERALMGIAGGIDPEQDG